MCIEVWLKKKIVNSATAGSMRFLQSLRKFFDDSSLVNEIYDEIDKNVFFEAANTKEYHYIEDIKENDIFDLFVEECIKATAYDVDVNSFVKKYYTHKNKKAQSYIADFYTKISNTIYACLKKRSSPDTKLILHGLDEVKGLIADKSRNDDPTIVVCYSANFQKKRWKISNYQNAILDKTIIKTVNWDSSESIRFPTDGLTFWEEEKKRLEYNTSKIAPFLEDGENISIFALAPIPLLILLGNQFSNRANIEIYQLQKNPNTWAWNDMSDKLGVVIDNLRDGTGDEAIMLLSISGKVRLSNVARTIDIKGKRIVEMSINNPYSDCLKSKSQLDEFITEYRKVKDRLSALGVKKIHIFAAVPVAIAVAIGQAYNSNFDPLIVTYDHYQGKYTKVYEIGERV